MLAAIRLIRLARISPAFSTQKMALFFYDGRSHGRRLEGLLNDGEAFANRLMSGFSEKRDWPQLMHIATDGEVTASSSPRRNALSLRPAPD